ncbi:MAG: right-handed parallel beta-helix repeat-containing protein [Bacteroidota bacterium]
MSPTGDDTNPGTSAAPVQTLDKAFELVQTSGTITLGPGTYREGELRLNRGGTSTKPLVIEGAGMDQTFLKGSQALSGWEAHSGNIWKINWAINSQQVFCNGQHLQQIGGNTPWHTQGNRLPPVGNDLGDLVPGSFFWDPGTRILYVMLADESDPNLHLMEASVQNYLLNGGNVSHVELRDLTLAHTNGTYNGERGYCLRLSEPSWTIERVRMLYPDYAGILVKGAHHRIRDCEVLYCGNVGLDVYNSDAAHNYTWYPDAPSMDLIIERNEVSYNNYRLFRAAWHAGGMKMIPAVRGAIVRDNVVRYNQAPGIWIDTPTGENRIENNLVIGNQTGIFYEIAREIKDLPVSYGGVICNNIVIGDYKQGIYVSASSDVEVKNNTVYDCWVGIVVHGMPRGDYVLKNNSVHHNIINGTTIGDLILFTGTDSDNHRLYDNFYVADILIDGQQHRSNPRIGITNSTGYGINYTNLDVLRNNTPYGDGSLVGNPLWANAENQDFSLLAGSPAEGKGITGTSSCDNIVPPPTPPVDPCSIPPDWNSLDIGTPSLAGKACWDSTGLIRMEAAGADIWYGRDEFHYLYQNRSGDGEMVVQVQSVEAIHEYTKVGLMIRSSLEADAVNAMMYLSPVGRWSFQRRTSIGANAFSTKSQPGAIGFPHWIRISRTGNEIRAYHSPDGQNWEFAASEVLPLGTDAYWGLAVTSHDENRLAEAVFTNLQTQLPGTSPFPVELISFEAAYQATSGWVQLDWRTATETNNDYFELARSIDGQVFEPIAWVQAAERGEAGAEYEWQDTRPIPGKLVYRLSQTDLNGSQQVLDFQEVVYPNRTPHLFVQFANLLFQGEELDIELQAAEPQALEWLVVNALGQTMTKGKVRDADVEALHIPTDAFPPGIYYLVFLPGIAEPPQAFPFQILAR